MNRRQMNQYDRTKSDPICRWRTASVETIVELVSHLPKKSMSKEEFRVYMSEVYNGAFFRTPYQLALQLALYYEDEERFIPRFDHNITEEEARIYMQKWIKLYYVPNPFTKRGFINVCPSIILLNGIAEYLEEHPNKPNLATAGAALFGGEMGNISCVKFLLNEYSDIIEVDKNNDMKLHYSLQTDAQIFVDNNREDKQAFFEHFK